MKQDIKPVQEIGGVKYYSRAEVAKTLNICLQTLNTKICKVRKTEDIGIRIGRYKYFSSEDILKISKESSKR